MGQPIDGKAIAAKQRMEVREEVKALKAQGISVGLAVVIVGEDPASQVYVRNKRKACEEAGIHSEIHALKEGTGQEQLLALIQTLNQSKAINGILVQSPVPGDIQEGKIVDAILPIKDVDAFHPYNVGKIMIGDYQFLPCTPAGVMALIDSTGVSVAKKRCVVVGRSNIVGKPMAMLLLQRDGTVTICHSKTQNLKEICLEADILVAAVGKQGLITGDMVKPGAVVIDVGMNRDQQGKLCGDVDYQAVLPIAAHITPVPGGVGPMTIAMLLKNTVTAAKLQQQLNGVK